MTPSPSQQPLCECAVRHVAYHIWIERGREPGQELAHWFEAERRLRSALPGAALFIDPRSVAAANGRPLRVA